MGSGAVHVEGRGLSPAAWRVVCSPGDARAVGGEKDGGEEGWRGRGPSSKRECGNLRREKLDVTHFLRGSSRNLITRRMAKSATVIPNGADAFIRTQGGACAFALQMFWPRQAVRACVRAERLRLRSHVLGSDVARRPRNPRTHQG